MRLILDMAEAIGETNTRWFDRCETELLDLAVPWAERLLKRAIFYNKPV